jgi:hypothetical protein
MEKEFIPYEQALALKELGFDEPCIACYTENAFGSTPEQKVQYWREPIGGNDDYVFVLAPLYQQAFRFFKEKYDLYSHVRESLSIDNMIEFVTQINGSYVNHGIFDKPINRFEIYEEAQLECLKKLIEIVKNK